MKPQPKPSTTETAIEPETQNRLQTLKPGDTVRIRTNKEKTWDSKGWFIASNDGPRSYNILNKNVNLIIRNRRHLIPTNMKFSVKHYYENVIEPNETPSRKTVAPARTDILSNIVAPSVRTKSERITRKPKMYLEECWIVTKYDTLHKKSSFPLSISPVIVTKSAGNCRFGHIYWTSP